MTDISNMIKKGWKANRGFTLLEVLVALAILAVSLVSLLGLHNYSLALVIREQNLTPALLLAQEMMTRTHLEGLAAASQHPGGDFETIHPGLYPGFRWQREILPTEIDSLWEVRVRVLWGEQEEERCELTYFTPLGP
jgi:general secretion pathway protein I